MLKPFVIRFNVIVAIGAMIMTSNTVWSQTAKIVVGGNVGVGTTSPTQPMEAAGIIYSNTGGFKFPDGSIQTRASQLVVGTNTLSIVNNVGGGNYSAAPYTSIVSGHNDSIYPSADYAVIIGGSNNAIRTTALNISGPVPANPNSHNFIGSGEFNTIRANVNHAAILGGRNNTIATGAANSVILGGSSITATLPNTVYMQNASLKDLALSGSGYRMVMVDSSGNLISSKNPVSLQNGACGTPWCTSGIDGSAGDFLGIKNFDLVIKTNEVERMRISQTNGNIGINTTANSLPTSNTNNNYKLDVLGSVRVLTGNGTTADNIVLKTVDEPGPNGGPTGILVPKIGVGTENPVRGLHVVSKHLNTSVMVTPPPSCPTCLSGPYNGLRLEDFTKDGNSVKNTIWDIAPQYNTIAQSGMLVLGVGDPANPFTLNGKMVLMNNGNVGIGKVNPGHTLDVNGIVNATNYYKNGQPLLTGEWSYAANGCDVYNTNLTCNVGVGINAPSAKLDVYDGHINIKGKSALADTWTSTGHWRVVLTSDLGSIWRSSTKNNANHYMGFGMTTDGWAWATSSATDANSPASYPMRLISNSNGTWLLQVCGKLRIAATGCDFVFADNYEQMSWQEKELYYKTNKRLPFMDSALEMENNGLEVSSNFSGLLRNVEENTLDITELYKRLETIVAQNEKLIKQNDELKKEIINLKEQK